jgi:MATE family multidrug resistance protein
MSFTLLIIGQGVVAAVGALVAQARGAGDYDRIRRCLPSGAVVALLLAVPSVLLLSHLEPFLRAIGQAPDLATAAAGYTSVQAWALPAGLLLAVQRNFLSALGRPRPIVTVATIALFVNAGLNYALIFGAWGFPKLGLPGAGLASVIVFWLMAAVLALWISLDPTLRRYRAPIWPDRAAIVAILRLGGPIGVIFAVEAGLFTATAQLMGLFGTTALAAHQIAMGTASMSFMVPVAIGQAASVRIGWFSGARNPPAARQAGLVALAMGAAFMLAMGFLIQGFAEQIAKLYLAADDPHRGEVIELAVRLLGLAALFQVFDGVQAIAAGNLRGLADTKAPMIAGIIGYWGIGMTAGIGLAFSMGRGPIGLWWGLVVGLVAASVLLILRFLWLSRPTAMGGLLRGRAL